MCEIDLGDLEKSTKSFVSGRSAWLYGRWEVAFSTFFLYML